MAIEPSLQEAVDHFGRSLTVPSKLLAMHPRKRGNPGNAAALAPAIALAVLSAFEGFAEDFTATSLYLSGDGFGQIAHKVGRWNNPTIMDFERRMCADFPAIATSVGAGVLIQIYRTPPVSGSSWWTDMTINWDDLKDQAEAWMQVRHCLTHGLTTGWRPERWPGPLRSNAATASRVLRPNGKGLHSLALHGALNCARIYVEGARHLANLVANELGEVISWENVPLFDV